VLDGTADPQTRQIPGSWSTTRKSSFSRRCKSKTQPVREPGDDPAMSRFLVVLLAACTSTSKPVTSPLTPREAWIADWAAARRCLLPEAATFEARLALGLQRDCSTQLARLVPLDVPGRYQHQLSVLGARLATSLATEPATRRETLQLMDNVVNQIRDAKETP